MKILLKVIPLLFFIAFVGPFIIAYQYPSLMNMALQIQFTMLCLFPFIAACCLITSSVGNADGLCGSGTFLEGCFACFLHALNIIAIINYLLFWLIPCMIRWLNQDNDVLNTYDVSIGFFIFNIILNSILLFINSSFLAGLRIDDSDSRETALPAILNIYIVCILVTMFIHPELYIHAVLIPVILGIVSIPTYIFLLDRYVD